MVFEIYRQLTRDDLSQIAILRIDLVDVSQMVEILNF